MPQDQPRFQLYVVEYGNIRSQPDVARRVAMGPFSGPCQLTGSQDPLRIPVAIQSGCCLGAAGVWSAQAASPWMCFYFAKDADACKSPARTLLLASVARAMKLYTLLEQPRHAATGGLESLHRFREATRHHPARVLAVSANGCI